MNNPYIDHTPGYEYMGDESPEQYGGVWIGIQRTSHYDGNVGHVIEVLTSSDLEDMPDNRCLIQTGTIFYNFKRLMQAKHEIKQSGITFEDCTKEQRRATLLDFVRRYHGFDQEYSYTCNAGRLSKNIDHLARS